MDDAGDADDAAKYGDGVDRAPFDADADKYRKKAASSASFSTWWSVLILAYLVLVFLLVVYMDQRLPAPLTAKDAAANPDAFIEERARNYLKQLTRVGPRPAGSYENEVLTVDFLKRELAAISARAKPFHRLTVDVQKPRGSFNLAFVDGLTHHYRNIQNVVVKMESGKHGASDALLVNCHFDSVPQSPGASDDAVSCAIMLEILDVLVQSDLPFRHNLIFLFNGAEENLLPVSGWTHFICVDVSLNHFNHRVAMASSPSTSGLPRSAPSSTLRRAAPAAGSWSSSPARTTPGS